MNIPDITKIPTEKLTHVLTQKGYELADAEKSWIEYQYNREALLASTADYISSETGISYTKAEGLARNAPEYQSFIKEMAEAKKKKIIARTKVNAIEAEIKVRLNKSYSDRTELKSGRIDP